MSNVTIANKFNLEHLVKKYKLDGVKRTRSQNVTRAESKGANLDFKVSSDGKVDIKFRSKGISLQKQDRDAVRREVINYLKAYDDNRKNLVEFLQMLDRAAKL